MTGRGLPRTAIGIAALALLGLSGLTGCGRGDASPDVDVVYGDGVGIRIEGARLAPYDVAVAVDQGDDLRPLVQPLSGLVHAALLGCPVATAPRDAARATTLSFSIEDGDLRRGRSATSGEATTEGEACLIEKLEGRPLSVAAPPRHVLLQIRRSQG